MQALRGQRRFAGMGRPLMRKIIAEQLEEIKAAGTFKKERVITSPQAGSVTTSQTTGPVLNFCANNYLGLSNHPDVTARAAEVIAERGFGMSSVRFICGTQDLHVDLENKLSNWLGTEETILYPSCFDANAGVFECLLTDQDAVISDSLNHASIIDGIRLCKAERHRYNHLDMENLEEILKKTQNRRIRMIVTDGVFSMDGDVAPLDKIVALADQYDAVIFVDDCHGTGIMGPGGRGSPALFNVSDKIDVLNSTLGKAMGGASGGFSSGVKEFVDLQRQKSRPYLFSNAIAPPVVAGTLKALDVVQRDDAVLGKLRANTEQFRTQMKAAGFDIRGNDACAIAPVMLGDAKLASTFADKMLEQGIYVIGFSFPVVPKGQARIRVQLSAAHSSEEVQRLIDAFISVKQQLNL
eukprot:TRINITY_DN36963_c0_g1_i1.p1 TRINITY_DN36963_c0_g1~~TRINITY_DN36963_c0_g1_i1.p1  ORF type:complete len:426 (+),score=143.51 TRINITY_DN36963_c0_g1_i1:50-1279(+)